MHLIYYWSPWSYTHQSSTHIVEACELSPKTVTWYPAVHDVWKHIDENTLAVLPIENSYAWSVHAHLYQFTHHNYHILYEYAMPIEHCLIATHTDISAIKHVFSHQQALDQCHDFCRSHDLTPHSYIDTASAVAHITQEIKKEYWAIWSSIAADIYWWVILQSAIQDVAHNTTRFLLVWTQPRKTDNTTSAKQKIFLLLEVKNVPGILHQCLWVLHKHHLDMTKIESLPSQQDPFSYLFWIETIGTPKHINNMLDAMITYTTNCRILGRIDIL